MKVAIDGRRLQDRPLGGVGRHLANVIPRLATEIEVTVLTDARRPAPAVPGLDSPVVALSVPQRVPETAWLHGAVPWWLRSRSWEGVFHGTYNGVPLLGAGPSVVTIHDLSWEHHPDGMGHVHRRAFQIQGRASARCARRILTPTEAVRRDVAATYSVDPASILVAPNAVDPVFGPRSPAEITATLDALGIVAPYVVALGGAPRRALPVAVEAWRASGAAELGVGLVVVGPEPPAGGGGPGGRVTWVGGVADAGWATVLAGAALLCYPTRFEGFGMPALEAAASGTPVVCARIPALAEVLGDAAEWCGGPTAPEIAAGVRRVLTEPGRRGTLAAAGLARAAAAPGWDDAAEATLRAYRQASP